MTQSQGIATIVGGSIASLVAAERLTSMGHPVELLLPAGSVGGGFESIVVEGRQLDLGFRIFELFHDGGVAPPVADYAPRDTLHQRQGPWTSEIDAYLRDLLGNNVMELDTPSMFVHGRSLDSIYLSSDLRAVAPLFKSDQRLAASVAREVYAQLQDNGRPDGFFGRQWDPSRLTLSQASLENHGPTFHRTFIEPLVAKINPGGSHDVLVQYRRKVWMPVFWPRTVLEISRGIEPAFRPHRPLDYVRTGGVGAVVRSLVARIENSGLAAVHSVGKLAKVSRGRGFDVLAFDDGVTLHRRHVILGVRPTELFAAAGQRYRADRTKLGVCWVEIPESDLRRCNSATWILDHNVPAYRVSEGGGRPAPGHRIFTVEFGHEQLVASGALGILARQSLEAIGMLSPTGDMRVLHQMIAPSLVIPTPTNRARFLAAQRAYDRKGLQALVVGGSATYAADSLNEQILQGLWSADKLAATHVNARRLRAA